MRDDSYRERVYAGWLGKCIGVRLGVPVENWTAAEIERTFGEVRGYFALPPGAVLGPDDDTAFSMLLIRALEAYGPDVTPAEIGETVLNLAPDGHGTLWWGGYGRSTEHTAYQNLKAGIAAPRSGSAALNGRRLSEQIGGQIFSDVWGLVCPGDPARAAELAARAAAVSHDGAAVDGGRFVAALVSLAFTSCDPQTLLRAALEQLTPGGEYAAVVGAVLEHHRARPGDWRSCLSMLEQHWGPQRYGGPVHVIPNAGVVAMALLYGDGDFGRSICIATMAGWDTDCNAGNAGAVVGVAAGLDGIGPEWRAPLNDTVAGAGLLGSRSLDDIPRCADLLARLGGDRAERRPRFHFAYPGSTHGLLAEAERGTIALRQIAEGSGALQISLRELSKKGESRVWAPTYWRPAQLSAQSYTAGFSPTIWPGQTLRARLIVPPDTPAGLLAAPFVWDDNNAVRHQAAAIELEPGGRHTVGLRIPALNNALLSRAGVAFRTAGQPWSGRVLLDWLDWDGPPEWSTDFSLDRPEYGALAGWTFVRGYWRLEDGAYHSSGAERSESYTGDPEWSDLTLSVDLVPLAGEQHHLLLRVGGARRSYAAGLHGADRLAILRNHGGYRQVASTALPWRHGQRLQLAVTVAGDELSLAADGQPLLGWRDREAPLLRGQIGLANGPGCHTRWERVAVEGWN